MPTREYIVTQEDLERSKRVCYRHNYSGLDEEHPADYCHNCLLSVCFERYHPGFYFDVDNTTFTVNPASHPWRVVSKGRLSDKAVELVEGFDDYIERLNDPNPAYGEPVEPELPVTLYEDLNLPDEKEMSKE